jgi:hypothetical protein
MLIADILAWAGLVSSRDEAKVTVWCAVGAAMGVYLFYRGFRMLQFKRLVLNTPLSKVRAASMGLVELSGMAVGPSTIPAGITGDDCYYYRATAWELQQSGNSRQWKQVANESLFVPFFVQDDTGRMLVNAQGADMDVHCNFKSEYVESFFGGRDMPVGPAEDFLLRHGVSGHRVRVEEYCIKPDYPLFVLGTLGENTARASSVPQKHVSAASYAINVRSSSRPPAFGVLGMFGGSYGRQAEIYASAGGPAASSWTGSSNRPPTGPSHGPSTWPSAPLPGHSSARDLPASQPSSAGARLASTAGSTSWSSISMDEVHPPVAATKIAGGTSVAQMDPVEDQETDRTAGQLGQKLGQRPQGLGQTQDQVTDQYKVQVAAQRKDQAKDQAKGQAKGQARGAWPAIGSHAPLQGANRPLADDPQVDIATATAFDLNAPAAIGKGDGSAPFTISSESQRELVRALGWKSAACIWGGPSLTVTCVYILLLTLGLL